MDKTLVRDAATIIVLRGATRHPSVLMGQRGQGAAFMPGKFVFPGGAVDPNDAFVPSTAIGEPHAARLAEESRFAPTAIAAAAIRELWEETGQIIGAPAAWSDPPQGWRGFAATGHQPNAAALSYFFRAITPHGRPRRFDARFLLADATALIGDVDNFDGAEDELAHLQWVKLSDARHFDLPFITQVVLAELSSYIANGRVIDTVPFFRNDDEDRLVTRLGGNSPLD